MFSERYTSSANYKIVLKGDRLSVNTDGKTKKELVFKEFSNKGSFNVKYLSVKSMADAVWTVCADQCAKFTVSSASAWTPVRALGASDGAPLELEASTPGSDAWRAEFWPEIEKFKPDGDGVTFDSNIFKASTGGLLNQINGRAPWHKLKVSSLALDVSGTTFGMLNGFIFPGGSQKIYTGNFAARFSATINIPKTAQYYLYTYARDGVEITVGGKKVLQSVKNGEQKWDMTEATLNAGAQEMVITYYCKGAAAGGTADARLWVQWSLAKAKCGGYTASNVHCAKSFISLPLLAGGPVLPTDFTRCNADSGAFTVSAWNKIPDIATKDVPSIKAVTDPLPPSKIFLANSIYFEHTDTYFNGLTAEYANNRFAIKVDAYFKAKEAGEYEFWLVSADGAWMWLDQRDKLNKADLSEEVLKNDGGKAYNTGFKMQSGYKKYTLQAGTYYKMMVYMWNMNVNGADLELYVKTPSDQGPRLLNCNDVTQSHLSETAKWAYMGCYKDATTVGESSARDLVPKGTGASTIADCYAECNGTPFFGLTGARQCVCGWKYGAGAKGAVAGTDPTKPSGCSCDGPAIGEGSVCVFERKAANVKDLAFGQQCEASNPASPAGPNRAVDGDTNNGALINSGTAVAATLSLTCTEVKQKAGQKTWWRVDMAQNRRIEGFAVMGAREIQYEAYSTNIEARVGNWMAKGLGDAVCASGVNAYAHMEYYACDRPKDGRYFSLWSPSSMVVCEVMVYGDTMDLAQGRPAIQSSTESAMATAMKAVDGDTNGDLENGKSCTHTDSKSDTPPWWRVDLGSSAAVESVTIWNRSDCCADRLSAAGHQFEVRVGDKGDNYEANDKCGDLHSIAPPAVSASIMCGGKTGQYVFIDIPVGKRVLTLCEVRVTGGHVAMDIAKNKPCGEAVGPGQTDTCNKANDGSIANDMSSALVIPCTETEGDKPWWFVDLQDEFKVSHVEVWGADGRTDQLSNFQVRVGDTRPEDTTFSKNRVCSGNTNDGKQDSQSFNMKDPERPTMVVDCNSEPGSYVSINLPAGAAKQTMSLCEVKVYGTVSKAKKTNLALMMPTGQVDTAYGGASDRAVDGNTETSFGKGSCTHTKKTKDPWWWVDLQKDASVSRVMVWNRSDCCGDKLNDFQVRVLDKGTDMAKPEAWSDSSVCGGKNKVDARETGPKVVNCEKKEGRYVAIDLMKTEYLVLCEVKVHGEFINRNYLTYDDTWKSYQTGTQAWQQKSGYPANPLKKWDEKSADFLKGSCSLTAKVENPFWYVDLGKETMVSRITIFKLVADMEGTQPDQMNIQVRVGNQVPGVVGTAGTITGTFVANELCGQEQIMKGGADDIHVDCDSKMGRFISVNMIGTHSMSMCGVGIEGVTAGSTAAIQNKCKASIVGLNTDLATVKADLKKAKAEVSELRGSHSTIKNELAKVSTDEKKAKSDLAKGGGGGGQESTPKTSSTPSSTPPPPAPTGPAPAVADPTPPPTEFGAKQSANDAALEKDMAEQADQCKKKQQQAQEEGRKAGLQSCPGVNGLMREIWRLRQKLGAAEGEQDPGQERR